MSDTNTEIPKSLLKKMDRRTFIKIAAGFGAAAAAGVAVSYAMSSSAKGRIVIIGGGCAGISMAARLKRMLRQPNITIIDPSTLHYYQPGFTLIASGVYDKDEVYRNQSDCIPSGTNWIKDSVVAVDPDKGRAYTASHELYDIPFFTPRLLEIYKDRNVKLNCNVRVKGIDTAAKKAYLERVEKIPVQTVGADGKKVSAFKERIEPFTQSYDFMHFLPPMCAPDFVKSSGLSWTEGKLARDGWAMVDKETLVHKKYPNIISLGDVAGIPTSKTSAAIRKQAPIAARNLVDIMEGKAPSQKYDGYAACPIITDYGHVLMCEFDYSKKPKITFPLSLLDMSHEQRVAWLLKVYVLKPMYFYGMLKGLA